MEWRIYAPTCCDGHELDPRPSTLPMCSILMSPLSIIKLQRDVSL